MIKTRFGALLLIVTIFVVQYVGAVESGPSNTVGFWKADVGHGFTQISFPLLPNDKTVTNVLGDQLTGAGVPEESDQIHRWNSGTASFEICWYNIETSQWEGQFSELSESESYWIYVQPTSPAMQTIITYGNIIEEPSYGMGQMVPGYNAIGSIWAMPAQVTQAGLNGFEGGLYLFLSDLLMGYDASTGSYSYAWQNESSTWMGDLTALEPLQGYWIYVAPGHDGFDWPNYPQPESPIANGIIQVNPNPIQDNLKSIPPVPTPQPVTYSTSTSQPVQSTSVKGGAQ
ncbi:hypothetical protein CEE37_06400 [candidate division LCP-89 bacterium B3_LCP]|uniref:Uncharacterized protein n=1 Tax=candidate division LCP-89 bacterium B3_LCP TaxID=2012998 RepID=A0A532V2D5_UNCL8|nr:MAG: hypothetical protein CEE37_06400 [candidate division LCP-89 bacterium B3_LCP]